MLIFVLHSTSEEWPCNLSDKSCPKYEKIATKSLIIEMLIFELYSTSDDRPSNLSDESHLKCEKMAAKMVKK